MIQTDKILGLMQGETITIPSISDRPAVFMVNMGDALLNGDNKQVWLEQCDVGNRFYLRRMPEKRMSVGPALFSSLEELAKTLNSGDYYIG